MVHLYGAFIQVALQRLCALHSPINTHTYSYTDAGGNHARHHQPAHASGATLGLAQGHLDPNSGGSLDPTGNPPGTSVSVFSLVN